ncbi:MAG TPA: toll/interleukin-1 receptor domain-containing protein, partial [Phototrophicaceae bacterium]|nr:toll/interleukin-1 receptor domain-containing protein [Phototrophicaceae bacterium]
MENKPVSNPSELRPSELNPLELPIPENYLERIHTFARDLVYGAVNGLWYEFFLIYSDVQGTIWRSGDFMAVGDDEGHPFYQLIVKKWDNKPPTARLMVAFEYLTQVEQGNTYVQYMLTPKAFALMEKPAAPPSVFISYKRSESSALGLLIEARLKLAGNPNPFIDKNLVVGEAWGDQLKEHIQTARYFICLIGPETLASPHVKQELTWAEESGCMII